MVRRDGVWVGTCDKCGTPVMRKGFVRLDGMEGPVVCLACYLFMPDDEEVTTDGEMDDGE